MSFVLSALLWITPVVCGPWANATAPSLPAAANPEPSVAQNPPATTPPNSADSADSSTPAKDPSTAKAGSLSARLSPWWAFAIGALGGSAYLVAAWAGFVGKDEDARDRVLKHFSGSRWHLLSVLHVVTAGGVAMVFQLPEPGLVPIQAFIIGCTWPAVVSNYLSGRQSGDGASQEAARINQEAKEAKAKEEVLKRLPKELPAVDDDVQKKLKALSELVSNSGSPQGAAGDDTDKPAG